MKILPGVLLTAILWASGSFPVHATEPRGDTASMEELLSLDIEELMAISVASKREERIENAPGVISVITARDIENYGATDLRDLLLRLPNTYGYSTGLFRDSITSIRGQAPSGLDNHALILLNGRPLRESFNGTITAPVYRNIPLEIIKRIEVVRGPGSVLYGSNAFAGAINIVTKEPAEKLQGSVTAGYASYHTAFTSGAAGQKIDGAGLMVAGKFLDSDGWPFRAVDESGIDNTRDFARRGRGLFARGSYKGTTLTAFSGRNDDNIYAGLAGWRGTNFTSNWERNFFDAQFDRDLPRDWKGKFNFTYNGTDGDSQGRRRNIDEFLFEPSASGTLFERINAVAGFTYQKIEAQLITERVPYSNDRFGAYLQGDYSPLSYLKLIAGLQVNKPQGIDYDFSPRGGVIVNFNPDSGVKLLYGEAFRSATAAEQTTTAVSVGDPGLLPEKVSTFDAQLFHVTPKYYAALTYYRSHQTDTIKVISDPIGLKIVNRGSIDYQGIELEGKAAVTQRIDLTGSISRQYNYDDTGNADIGRVPKLMIKTGMAYNWDKGYSLGLFNSYFSASGRMPGSRPVNPAADSYNFLTANASMKIRKVTGLDGLPDLTLGLFGENLLDENLYFPEVGRGVINTIPLRSGRAFFGSVSLGF
ncbi:MAG: TonB-dependent receptor plug domain-containing protein [Nitrospinae bacterium]|nr:TonB-dependent receptor plug domain-containing protein [Nitrospinota bacterium]